MGPRIPAFALMVLALSAGSSRLLAADDGSMVKDLKVTIALQGLPCDEVTDARRQADSDYLATCRDGHRYHVFVNAQGRVVVEKL
jgi:hypothetical protein